MIRSCTSQVSVQISSRNHRSWVTTMSPPAPADQRRFKCAASHAMPSTSRWLVGSSRNRMSQSPTSRAASATRRRWPPLSSPRVALQGMPPTSPSITSRTRASPAHSCSARSPTMACETTRSSGSSSAWSSMPRVMPLRRVTRPPSGSRRPDSSLSRLDLPSPLRPTTPMRWPSSSPIVTLSNTTRVGYSRWRLSAPSRCAISLRAYPLPTSLPAPSNVLQVWVPTHLPAPSSVLQVWVPTHHDPHLEHTRWEKWGPEGGAKASRPTR